MSLSVSVVTVCLNSARTIADSLESVNAQTHPDVEQIVVDGGSTDGTQDVVRRVGRRVTHCLSEPDRGIYDAMNKGLALARGDVVGFLNADDSFADAQALARVAEAFERGVDACYGDIVYVAPDDPRRLIRYWRSGPYRRGQCAHGWAPPHPSFYVRREVFEKHGGFDAAFKVAGDFEVALRLLDVAGIAVRYVPAVLVRMRTGGVSNRSVKGILQGHREMATALRRHGFPAGWGWSLKRVIGRAPQFLARAPAQR